MKPGAWWPIGIVGALAVTVAANALLIVAANEPRATVIEPDYYRKAVAFDSTMAERAADARLGWRVEAALSQPGTAGARLEAQVLDAAGAPLDGAEVRVVAVHNLDADRPVEARLMGAGTGRYTATLPLRFHGMWELRFVVERGNQRFTSDLRRDTGTLR